MSTSIDTLIVGAGPAGATAALNLAPTRSVWLIDAVDHSVSEGTVGESLAPAARRLLGDMGMLESFLREGHSQWYGNRSVWGSVVPVARDSLFDLDGPGWHLNRARFDRWLRAAAVERGAVLRWPLRVRSLEPERRGWSVTLAGAEDRITIRARTLIDATGRSAVLARRLGSHRESSEPRTLCAWLLGVVECEIAATAGFSVIEAVEDGWWYTAPLPHQSRVVAFHTAPDLPGRRRIRSTESFMEYSTRAPFVMETLRECGFRASIARVRWTVADGGVVCPPAGTGWFAAGDAAIHFDPVSSQGLLNVLFTGLACAEATDRVLQGADPQGVAKEYAGLIEGIRDAYVSHRLAWYGEERRWPASPFWTRHHYNPAA